MEIRIISEYKFTGGDAISYYDAHFANNPTLEDFVSWVIANNRSDWGYIQAAGLGCRYVEYRYGEVVGICADYDEIKGKIISLRQMEGGWTRMDYIIELEDNF